MNRGRRVLEEDEYLDQLEKIIVRDYYPNQSCQTNDKDKKFTIKEFMNSYTSEDDHSFNKIQRKEIQKQKERILEEEELINNKQKRLNSFKHRSRNQLMFPIDLQTSNDICKVQESNEQQLKLNNGINDISSGGFSSFNAGSNSNIDNAITKSINEEGIQIVPSNTRFHAKKVIYPLIQDEEVFHSNQYRPYLLENDNDGITLITTRSSKTNRSTKSIRSSKSQSSSQSMHSVKSRMKRLTPAARSLARKFVSKGQGTPSNFFGGKKTL